MIRRVESGGDWLVNLRTVRARRRVSATRDWRRTPRLTALGGLLDGALRFTWRGHGDADADGPDHVWEGLLGSGSGPEAPTSSADTVGPGLQPTGVAARR